MTSTGAWAVVGRVSRSVGFGWVVLAAGWVHAQPAVPTLAPGYNQVHLSASAEVETVQDWLTMTLNHRVQAPDARAVQMQLKSVLEPALSQARQQAQDGTLEVRSGNFSVVARYGRDGQISGWQGQADLILQGRDTAAISQLASRLSGLTVSHVGFSLSRDAGQRLEADVRQRAIAQFRSQAQEVAQAFGFASYRLGDVQVQAGGQAPVFSPRPMAMEARAASADAPVPVEPGKTWVQVTVSGTVHLH